MRIRYLTNNTLMANIWFAFVAGSAFWTGFKRGYGDGAFGAVDSWVTTHPVGPAWGFNGVQVTTLLYLFAVLLAAYAVGQWVIRPVFSRRWAVPLLFAALAVLDWNTAIWLAVGSFVILGAAYIKVTKGIGNGLAFVPLWVRVAYAAAFALMSWLMFGFTEAARAYPSAISTLVVGTVPQQWAFGFWVPELVLYALIAAAIVTAYVAGGYFFNYLMRHWSGPAALLVFLVVLTPWDRYRELATVVLANMAPVLHVLGWGFIVMFILTVARTTNASIRERDQRPIWQRVFPYPSGIDGVPSLYPDMDVPRVTSENET